MSEPSSHCFAIRVYYEDTDAAGMVYHSNYLKYAERARTEWLRDLGVQQRQWREDTGLGFAVTRCEIDFRRPARLDDVLNVATRVIEVGGASLVAEQIIRREADEVARLRLIVACIDGHGRPARLPKNLRTAMSAATARGVID
ncbi:MAG: tol-pal system-associated acyl-CoA thioesterase [Alphaproteobacteria bacterium]|nr:tol-pal system-associated acyl-CoA thioesterase [Alphaproteobacteria bacterium]